MKSRNRWLYGIAFIVIIIIGLLSRKISGIPFWIGDVLWASMIFLLLATVFNKKSTRWLFVVALVIAIGVEVSQLYHADWIDAIRANRFGRLVLGVGFLWGDLVCYFAGVLLTAVADAAYIQRR